MIKEFEIKDILNAVNIISNMEKKKSKIPEKKGVIDRRRHISI